MTGKKITICGSMKFLEHMKEWKEKLEKQGHIVFAPTSNDFHKVRDEDDNLEKFEEIKRTETKNHFQKVEQANVILIMNYDKNGKKNYIGGNTFAEIAYAIALNYCHGKKIEIYTVNPLPEDSSFYEELHAWNVRQWNEKLEK